MTVVLIPMMLLATVGLLGSALLHLIAWYGAWPAALRDGAELASSTLGTGIFVVWLPAVLLVRRNHSDGHLQLSWKDMLASCPSCPSWMRRAVYGLFAYAVLSFFLAMGTDAHSEWTGLRALSGHGMLFYGTALAIFYARWSQRRPPPARRCLLGHATGHSDAACPTCGNPLGAAPPPYQP